MTRILGLLVFAYLVPNPAFSMETILLSKGEICEISENMDLGGGEDYTKGDSKSVAKLCTYDVHSNRPGGRKGSAKG